MATFFSISVRVRGDPPPATRDDAAALWEDPTEAADVKDMAAGGEGLGLLGTIHSSKSWNATHLVVSW